MNPYHSPIETARMQTRLLTPQDAEAWAAFLGHPVANRFLIPPTDADPLAWARQWIAKQEGRYAAGTYGLLAMLEKGTGTLLGQCGLLCQHVDGRDEIEVGYHFFPAHWGKGYASEAARAMRDWGFGHLDTPSIVSIIHRDNLPSQRVAAANGMRQEKACEFAGLPVHVHRIWREEWEQMRATPG